ncbi:hypothetical protein Leryth_006869 [Lithospermum erythrorhizon]|nr:hypothetical protein Leryth_006869 [Lithospermum erythrorhizon]
MDKFCPIFPFQQHDEEDHHQLDFQNTISTLQFQQQQQPYIIQENLVTNHALVGSSDVGSFLNYNTVGHAGGEFHQSTFVDNNSGNITSRYVDFDSDDRQKKIIHKEIERQRRSVMTKLYASLKSLLPLESTKGRQSTSDLLHEAENHIRIKQKNIEELKVQRDNLEKWTKTIENSNLNSSINGALSSLPCNYCPVDISVKSHLGGMEILICIDLRMDGFQLSRVLEFVIAQGLCVVSCVCTRINGKILHIIQTEVSHLEVTEGYELKQRLFEYCY